MKIADIVVGIIFIVLAITWFVIFGLIIWDNVGIIQNWVLNPAVPSNWKSVVVFINGLLLFIVLLLWQILSLLLFSAGIYMFRIAGK